MAIVSEAYKENEALFRQINREARANPQSPYAGKWVGMVGGKVVAVADTVAEIIAQMKKIEPDRTKRFAFKGDADYDTTDYIWRV